MPQSIGSNSRHLARNTGRTDASGVLHGALWLPQRRAAAVAAQGLHASSGGSALHCAPPIHQTPQAGPAAAGFMLRLLRRLLGGLSGGAATRTMSTAAAESLEERLYACLFPGQRYSPSQAALLAGRLREVADSLGGASEGEPEEPASKKRKKEQRGRGAPPPPPAAAARRHPCPRGPAAHPPVSLLSTAARQGAGLLGLPAALRGPGAAVPRPRLRRVCAAGNDRRNDRGALGGPSGVAGANRRLGCWLPPCAAGGTPGAAAAAGHAPAVDDACTGGAVPCPQCQCNQTAPACRGTCLRRCAARGSCQLRPAGRRGGRALHANERSSRPAAGAGGGRRAVAAQRCCR